MRRTPGWPRPALLVLLFALVWQGFVTQTHSHAGPDLAVAARTVPGQTVPVTSVRDEQPGTPASPVCPLCEEQALFGAYVLSDPAVVAAPAAFVAWYMPAAILSSAVRQASHAWQSRAPPQIRYLPKL